MNIKLTRQSRRAMTKTVGTRFPVDWVHLLDAITARRELKHRAELIEKVLIEVIESEFPGATQQDAA